MVRNNWARLFWHPREQSSRNDLGLWASCGISDISAELSFFKVIDDAALSVCPRDSLLILMASLALVDLDVGAERVVSDCGGCIAAWFLRVI